MRELDLYDSGVTDAIIDALDRPGGVVMLQMPSVFVLLATATRDGAAALDRAKRRRPNKNYGTAAGDTGSFYAMARRGSLPPELDSAEAFDRLTGSFLRIRVASPDVDSWVLRGGTHQAVLTDGPHRAIFRAVEAAFADRAEPDLFAGHRYTAPLCTSANPSGDPLGSITDLERALSFGRDRQIPLLVRGPRAQGEAGSYPIFSLTPRQVRTERDGPGRAALLSRFPPHLVAS